MELLEKLNLANKELRKEFKKDVRVLGRGTCCVSCTLAKIYSEGNENYIIWKIYNSGMNRNIENYIDGKNKEAYAIWNLDEKQLDKVIEILGKYFIVEKPKNEYECICIKLI